jgi:hypothetical protein
VLPVLQLRHLSGSPPSIFFTLLVGAPGSLSAPARGPTDDVFYVDGECSRFYNSGTSQGARRRRFLPLMVDAPRSTSQTPPREPVIDVFYIDGGCSWISVSTRQGLCCRRFLALMVDAPGSTALAPLRELAVDVFYVDGGCSRISISTRQEARR